MKLMAERAESHRRRTFMPVWVLAVWFLAGCGRTPPRQVLLISIDTLRADHLGCYGYQRNTSPNIDALASRSRVYAHAYPAGCWTMPSHMSLLTGTLPSRHGVNMNWDTSHARKYRGLNEKIPMISTILKQHNPSMHTIKFARLPRRLGFGRGFDTDVGADPFHSEGEYQRLMKLIRDHRKKEFFCFVHTWMVHAPYSSARFLLEGKISQEDRDFVFHLRDNRPPGASKKLVRFIKDRGWFTPRNCMDLYDGGIYRVDEGMGRLVADLKKMGLYRDMLIILVSDHGEHFGEHIPGRFINDHGKDFYEEYVHVPLIIKYPRSAERGRVNTPVSLVDVVPTLLDLLKVPALAHIQGRILPRRDNEPSGPVPVIGEAISLSGIERKMIRMDTFKLMLTMDNPQGPGRMNWRQVRQRRLFQLNTDPGERRNLAARTAFGRIAGELEKRLARSLIESVKLNTRENVRAISEETKKQLETLGYL